MDLYDFRWLDSPYIHSSPCLIKIHIKMISNAFEIVFIERVFVNV